MSLVEIERDAPAAHEAIQRGRWDDAALLIRELSRQTAPDARAWSAALAAAQALVRGQVPLPDRAALSALPLEDLGVRVPTRAAADHGALGALARFEMGELRAWAELARRCESDDDGDGDGVVRRKVTEARLSFADGELEAAAASARQLADTEGSLPSLAIEALCIESLCHLTLGHSEAARAAARQACRRSRESELRAHRFLSGLVLARVRRSLGRGHLAGRILCAMRPILPATYRGWLRWELTLCGQEASRLGAPGTSQSATDALSEVLEATARGDAAAFASRLDSLRHHVTGVGFLAPEVDALAALLDPTATTDAAPTSVREFLRGDDPRVPLGLDALSSTGEADGRPVAVALRRGTDRPRRLLTIASALAGEAATTLPLTRLRKGRVDLACTVLALAEDGLSEEELFRACYGFKFARHLHEGVLSMLVSRVRERLAGLYEVERSGGTVRLVGGAAILVPDPRCTADVEQKLLKLVARMGSVSTRIAARELGVSLRTVQDTVSRLVEDDELTMDRSGRSVGYRLEDTSFSELTTD